MRPRIRPAAHTSSHLTPRVCSARQRKRQHDCFIPAKPVLCPSPQSPWLRRWPRHVIHHRGHGGLPHLRHTNSLPTHWAPLASASRAHTQGFRLSEVLCHGVAPVLRRTRSCPSILLYHAVLILLYHARLPLSSADLAVADSPSFARRRTAAQRRAMRHVAPVARCRQAAEAIRRLLKGYAAHTHRQTILWFCRQAAAAIRRRPTMPAASSKSVSSTLSPPLEDGLPTRPDFESSTGHVADQALIRRMIRVHDSTQGRAPYGRSPSDRAPRPALRARATAASVRSPGTRAFHLWSA